MHQRLKGSPGIYLAGFMGCGKSTVGRLLAERLGWTFVDLDAEIELAAGKPIQRIFDEDGEPAFREQEARATAGQACAARGGRPRVVALGGGTYALEANRQRLRDAGLTIWLDAPVDALWERVRVETERPLARDEARFRALYDERRPAYAEADYRIEADRPPREVVEAILALEIR